MQRYLSLGLGKRHAGDEEKHFFASFLSSYELKFQGVFQQLHPVLLASHGGHTLPGCLAGIPQKLFLPPVMSKKEMLFWNCRNG